MSCSLLVTLQFPDLHQVRKHEADEQVDPGHLNLIIATTGDKGKMIGP
jgi:hypothetical protein